MNRPPAATPKIELRNVHKRFDRKVVLDGIDLEVGRGESVVVIGGSGSGKSVMLKCILGLMRPEQGSIRVDGQETIGMRAAEREQTLRKFGMLFQGSALFDSLRVWENVAFGLIQGRSTPRTEAKTIALDKLAQVGLGPEVGELSPAELSGGMQKRVALARAIATEPEIIFFDEPTTGLDPMTSASIAGLIRDTTRQLGATAVVVTHDLALTRHVADRIAFLDAGRFRFVGTWAEAAAGADPLVSRFLAGQPEEEDVA